jgi:FkbH-like protein
MNSQETRQEIDRLIAEGNAPAAAAALAELWAHEKSPAAAAFAVLRYERLRPQLALQPYRVAILRSFTVEPMVPMLRAAAFSAGLDLNVYLPDFNAYPQEILDPGSSLYRFLPDAAFLVVQTRDVAPELWKEFADLDPSQIRSASSRVTADFRDWVAAFRKNSKAHLIVQNLEQPSFPAKGVLDAQGGNSQRFALEQINQELQNIATEQTGVYILDYDSLVARHGRNTWHNEQRWLTTRLPVAGPSMNHIVDEWMRFLHPLAGKMAKCLVVDLDNTLWGGIIGEDGMDGIRLGTEYPGAAYQELQRALLDLHGRGVLLAICSKNNSDDAWEVLNHHPGMNLQPGHFAAARINWAEKSANLCEIAGELNIGLDSLAFLDDNPVERRQVRSSLPEVWVVPLPGDPMLFARTVRESPLFERLSLSTEDRQRGEMYQAQQEREQLQQKIPSREDFFRSLRQEAEIAPVSKTTLARVAQLINKTNQFNLTTRRYSEQQIAELCATAAWSCFSLRVRDRFGDNGLVGVAITHCQGDSCEIDTFLLSCRVIGRTLEPAFLSFLASYALARGASRLQGWFRPTKKNQPARDFYASHGFVIERQEGDAALWSLELSKNLPACPDWIHLRVLAGQPNGDANGETK